MNHGHNCHEMMQTLSDYVDGDLDGSLCEELEKHLQDCKNCRIVVNTLRKTIELYQVTSTEKEIPVGVRVRLFARLQLDEFCGSKQEEY